MLKIQKEFRKGILFIRIKGNLEKESNTLFSLKVTKMIENMGIRCVVFNMCEMSKIDLKGIHNIYYIYEFCNRKNGEVYICNLKDNVYQKLKNNNAFRYLKLINNELEAFKLIKI